MATGDQNDIYNRLKYLLVPWFGSNSPNLDALLQGRAFTGSYIYQLISYTQLQTRINTATDYFLDYVAQDFFGGRLPRKANENDATYRQRIKANLFQEKCTKQGMINVLTTLTGTTPVVIEPFDAGGAIGAWDVNFYYDEYLGYGWGQPYTAIIRVYKPAPEGFYSVGGYDPPNNSNYFGGFGYDFNFNNAYVDTADEVVTVSESDILYAIAQTKVYGTFMYVTILDTVPSIPIE